MKELSALDIQRIFRITPPTLYNWRKNKGFPFHKMEIPGKRNTPVRFFKEEILEWAKNNHLEIYDEDI